MDIDLTYPTTDAKAHAFLNAFTGEGKIKGISVKDVTINPPSLTAGSTGSTTGTFIGASVGDGVVLIPPYDMQQIVYNGAVSAADTIEVTFHSGNAGTVDLASGTWKAMVLHTS